MRFAVDYPGRDLNRLSGAFRIFTLIPIGRYPRAIFDCIEGVTRWHNM